MTSSSTWDKVETMKAINIIIDNDQLEFKISYSKWLQEAFSKPSIEELNEMERDLCRPLTVKNRIVTHRPLNNPHYQPQGV